jgi:hypothetical protein
MFAESHAPGSATADVLVGVVSAPPFKVWEIDATPAPVSVTRNSSVSPNEPRLAVSVTI